MRRVARRLEDMHRRRQLTREVPGRVVLDALLNDPVEVGLDEAALVLPDAVAARGEGFAQLLLIGFAGPSGELGTLLEVADRRRIDAERHDHRSEEPMRARRRYRVCGARGRASC